MAVLRSYGVLDTAPEPAYDDIVALAAALCETPIAVISLVDQDRQWFKAVHGADWKSTARDISFCAHAIEQRGVMHVEDAAVDPRFADNPLVCGEVGLRFYAGVPLVDAEGLALGALAVIDRVPRRLNELQHQALRVLAGQVVTQLQTRRRQRLLEDALLQREEGQAALRESESRWRLLFERNPLPMWIFDIETLGFLAVNDAAVVQYGWSPSEFLSMTLKDIRLPEDVPALMADLAEGHNTLHGGTIWRHRKKSGQLIHVDIVAHSIHFDGRPARLVLAQDVSERLRAMEALQRQHTLVKVAGRMARLGGWEVIKHPQPVVHWTDELRVILGFAPDETPGVEQGINMYLPGSREAVAAALQACLDEGRAFDLQVEMCSAAGRHLHARVIGEPQRDASGHIQGAQGALIDLTELHQAQQAMRRSEERFRHVSRATADAIWDWDLLTGSCWWNEGIETLFGHALATLEAGAGSWTSRIHPDDLGRVKGGIDAVITGGGERWADEYRFARADGSWAEVSDRGFVLRDEQGRALRMVGGMSDLTVRRQSERQLRRQAALLDAARDAIVLRDLDDRILYWSQGAERLFGWSAAEAAGHRAPELLGEDDVVLGHARQEVLRCGEWQAVVQCRARDGRALQVDMRLTLLRDAHGAPEAVLAIKTDVTQRLALEQQLQQAQRLEAVGQLTGGVAHDFNNLLTVIQGNSELLVEHLAEQKAPAQVVQMAQMVSTAAERGAELTHRLLAFARKQPLQPMSVDAHQLLAGMDALMRRTLPEDIELELVRAAGLWSLLADPVQVESAVLNLVLNARDAMPQGGKITLETANAWIDQDYAERHIDVLPGQYVLISVSDTGVGMSAADLARAFEPFFTTKGVGKGTGLGLSMVYGFAKQSRGHVKLYSEPGQGTTARLYLPRSGAAGVSNTFTGAARADGELRGSATVLVVEDDDLVRRFAADLLRGLGYQVLVAENGVTALAMLRTRHDVDLLFTDVVMPGGLNGRQLADAALALHPRLKVLFTSGYTENAIVHHGRLDRGVHLLAKPYRAVDLARRVYGIVN